MHWAVSNMSPDCDNSLLTFSIKCHLTLVYQSHRFMEMLRPGGRLLISDYCRKAGAVSKSFEKYIKKRGYDLQRYTSS
jgi:hypothetical protein